MSENTDRVIWLEHVEDDYPNNIHVTADGGIGINVGGRVIVKPIREWHALSARVAALEAAREPKGNHCPCCGADEVYWNGPFADTTYKDRDDQLARAEDRVAELEAQLRASAKYLNDELTPLRARVAALETKLGQTALERDNLHLTLLELERKQCDCGMKS